MPSWDGRSCPTFFPPIPVGRHGRTKPNRQVTTVHQTRRPRRFFRSRHVSVHPFPWLWRCWAWLCSCCRSGPSPTHPPLARRGAELGCRLVVGIDRPIWLAQRGRFPTVRPGHSDRPDRPAAGRLVVALDRPGPGGGSDGGRAVRGLRLLRLRSVAVAAGRGSSRRVGLACTRHRLGVGGLDQEPDAAADCRVLAGCGFD